MSIAVNCEEIILLTFGESFFSIFRVLMYRLRRVFGFHVPHDRKPRATVTTSMVSCRDWVLFSSFTICCLTCAGRGSYGIGIKNLEHVMLCLTLPQNGCFNLKFHLVDECNGNKLVKWTKMSIAGD